ncbi:flagellar hook-associated protein 2 [Clostridium botulinum A1 str. CFSAN002368]|nr:flagellar hook-associated protein 2 [Clostridium botulinum A1 str. CFSAN002368]
MRIGGLSGLDTDNMIKNMMKPYTMRVDKMKQNAQIVKWQQDAYRSVISGISEMTKNILMY